MKGNLYVSNKAPAKPGIFPDIKGTQPDSQTGNVEEFLLQAADQSIRP